MQQSKAKSYVFGKIDNNPALWLYDFIQNPIKYCERQQYFGRKGMALHNDVFLYNLNDSIQKKCLHDSSKMV